MKRQKTNTDAEGHANGAGSSASNNYNTNATIPTNVNIPHLQQIASQSYMDRGPGSLPSGPGSIPAGYGFNDTGSMGSTLYGDGNMMTTGNDLIPMNKTPKPPPRRSNKENDVELQQVEHDGYIEDNNHIHDHGYIDNNAESDHDDNEQGQRDIVMPEHMTAGGIATATGHMMQDNDNDEYVAPPPVPPVPIDDVHSNDQIALPYNHGVTKGSDDQKGNDLIPPPIPPVPKDEEEPLVLPGNTSAGTKQ